MATNTPNYNLKKPAPTDFYNIADFNGNADIIDAQMKSNANAAQNALEIGMGAASRAGNMEPKVTFTLTCTKSGKVYTLGNPDKNVSIPVSGLVSCMFKVPSNADYAVGDSFKMGNTTYSVSTSDGEELPDKAFVSGAVVPVVLDQTSKTINFKQAGRKLTLSAESYVMVQCYTQNGTFVAPMTGKYRVTCIAKGGNGGDSNIRDNTYQLNGAGGGAGGAGQIILNLKKGELTIPVTANGTASFGSYLSAGPGENASLYVGSGSTSNYYVIPGQPGNSSGGTKFTGMAGKPGTNINYNSLQNGGDGGAYQPGQSTFLATNGGAGGHYNYDTLGNPQLPVIRSDGAAPDKSTPSGLAPFGAGGGGAIYGYGMKGGSGGQAAVIVELLLD